MKSYVTIIFVYFVISLSSVSYSQKLSAGLSSGINFSHIHGQEIDGKWSHKPGPVQDLFVAYSFNRSLGLQTGFNFSTVYYEHKVAAVPYYNYPLFESLIAPVYSSYNQKMDFSFIRIPVLFTVKIPTALQFELKAGLFISFLQNYSLNDFNYFSGSDNAKPAKNDFGYIFSFGFSYPFSDRIKASFNSGYITGHKKFLDNFAYRHSSSEFTLGLAYSILPEKKNENITTGSESDSTKSKIEVILRGGINYSWNSGFRFRNQYSPASGPSFGFYLNFPLKYETTFQTGISFVRKGYSLDDSSNLFYRYSLYKSNIYYVDTKVQLDYVVVPALINFLAGRHGNVSFTTGPWLALKVGARTVGVAYDESRSGDSYFLRKTVVYDDLERIVNNYDIGWIFGGGISVPVIKHYSIDLALQYSVGFMEVYNKSGLADLSGPGSTSVIKNGAISFLIGIKIPPADR